MTTNPEPADPATREPNPHQAMRKHDVVKDAIAPERVELDFDTIAVTDLEDDRLISPRAPYPIDLTPRTARGFLAEHYLRDRRRLAGLLSDAVDHRAYADLLDTEAAEARTRLADHRRAIAAIDQADAACPNGCASSPPYGWVPAAGCPTHDTAKARS